MVFPKLHWKELSFFILQIVLCLLGYLDGSVLVFKIAVCLILFYCVAKGSRQAYVLNPYFLLILTPISLLMYHNISDFFMVDLTKDTWLLIVCNVNAVLIGITCTPCIRFRRRLMTKSMAKQLYTVSAWAFTLLGIIPPIVYRFTGIILPLSYIVTMFGAVGVMSAMATKKRWLYVFMAILYALPIALGGASKSGVLTLLLTLIIAYEKYYVAGSSPAQYRKMRRWLIVSCVFAIPVMVSAFSFANKERGDYDAEEGFEFYESRVEWEFDKVYFLPYMYIVTPWTNLQYVTETQDTRSNGYWLTKPLLGTFLGDELEEKDYVPEAYSSFNTFSFIGLHFKDFGYWGSLFVSLFLGLFIKKVYSLFAQSPLPYDAASYVFTAQATLEMFFSNHFFGQSYPFMIVIVMYIFKKTFRI